MNHVTRGLLGLVAGASALVAAACGGGDDGGAVEGVDADALLESAAERMDRVDAFHFVLTQENGTTGILMGLELVSAEGDIAGADRAQLEVRAKLGSSNLSLAMVILPEASYMTNPLTGRWQEAEISISSFFNPEIGVTALMRAVTDAKATRRVQVGGVDTYLVEALVDSGNLDLFAAGAPPGRELVARA
ncbi:MAG: LppX_LprAFG lipoprotein, partial [Dehalococcoidia bacterium]|nr:LppX_LprAFG lipoprotein [Dehalococcoidia bacterium]